MDTAFNTNAAGEYLHEMIPGESPKYWHQRLINLRRTDRKQSYVLPFFTVGKGAFYEQLDLERFAEFEKLRRIGEMKLTGRATEALHAFGVGKQGGGTQGRRWTGASAKLAVGHDDSGVFVQTIIKEPLMVFAMTPEQALQFGKDLVEASQAAQRINSQREEK